MVLEEQYSPTIVPTQPMETGYFSRHGQGSLQTLSEKSDRESKIQQIHQQTVLNPQEEFRREKDHFRPISPEPVYTTQFLQDAHLERNKITTSPGGMDSLHRSQRWLLAPVSSQSISPLPGLQVQGSKLEVQSHAIWPEHCPFDFHKTYQVLSPQASRGEHMVSPIPGRPPDHCTLRTGLPTQNGKDSRDPTILGMDHKHGEIQTHPTTSLRMAGHPIQPGDLQSTELIHSVQEVQLPAGDDFLTRMVHQTQSHGDPGNCKLARTSGPTAQNSVLTVQTLIEGTQANQQQHQTCPRQQTENSVGEMVSPTQQLSPTWDPRTPLHYPDRCFQDRHRVHDKLLQSPHDFGQINGPLLNQCPGTSSHLDGDSQSTGKEYHYEDSDRQLNSPVSNQKGLFHNISPSFNSRDDMEESFKNELDPLSNTHQGVLQCSGRPTVKKCSHINRVVTTKRSIQTRGTKTRAQARSRPIRNKPEQPTGPVLIPLSRFRGKRNKRSNSKLGNMEPLLPVSPQAYDFEGFTEAETVKHRKCTVFNSSRARTSVLETTEISAFTCINIQSETTASSSQQTCKRDKNFHNSRVEILKEANSSIFPGCDDRTISLMSESVQKTSEGEYQRKWETFLAYARSIGTKFEDINKETVVRFLSHLFHVRNLKPSTITLYRSALSRPLLIYFEVNLNCDSIRYLLRGMTVRRPKEPSPKPQWSLHKVLTLLENIINHTETSSLRKTAFLLLLATGWRISEVHACVRELQYTSFNERGSLLIKPHSSFLAKNGLRKRIEQREIRTLLGSDGQLSKICPVSAIRQYLNMTHTQKSGCLFLNPRNSRALTLSQLKYQICSLITEADPNTRAKVHDIRKYAASISLQQDMIVGDLIEDFNWSSAATFYKFYFMQTEHPGMPVSIPVRNTADCHE